MALKVNKELDSPSSSPSLSPEGVTGSVKTQVEGVVSALPESKQVLEAVITALKGAVPRVQLASAAAAAVQAL